MMVDWNCDWPAWLEAAATSDTDECLEWPWSLTAKGYGQVRLSARTRRVTHLVLELSGKLRPPAPADRALHSCDNPPCCNPRHLRWGSDDENQRDRARRNPGTQPVGERNGQSKLTADDVRGIRLVVGMGMPQRELARAYGVSHTAIRRVVSGLTWSHVNAEGATS